MSGQTLHKHIRQTYNTIQYNTIQHTNNTIQYNTIQYNTVQYRIRNPINGYTNATFTTYTTQT